MSFGTQDTGVQCSCDYWADDKSELAFSRFQIYSETHFSLSLFELGPLTCSVPIDISLEESMSL